MRYSSKSTSTRCMKIASSSRTSVRSSTSCTRYFWPSTFAFEWVLLALMHSHGDGALQMEIDRLRYMVSSYLRTRLRKASKTPLYVDCSSLMSNVFCSLCWFRLRSSPCRCSETQCWRSACRRKSASLRGSTSVHLGVILLILHTETTVMLISLDCITIPADS